jgi:GH25 family lysozyme M1 (1,4-beta-N-acetylmuramidase)
VRAVLRRTAVASALAAAFAGCAETSTTETPGAVDRKVEPQACTAPNPVVQGVDVSDYQGTIDWTKVKGSGVDFAIIRVSDGTQYPDSKFASYWPAAKAAGLVRGTYQYFEPDEDVIAQADLLLQTEGTLDAGDLPPTLDVETTGTNPARTPQEMAAEVKQWVDYVGAATGKTPMIYVGQYFWMDQVGGADQHANPLWEAQWGVTCPTVPAPWTAFTFWQYSATGTVPGITGQMDLDVFNGDLTALGTFAGVHAVCGDGVCASAAGEDSDTCPADCPPCGTIDATGGVVDDGDACFIGGGPAAYLRAVTGSGWENDLVWTHATNSTAEANYATWDLHLAEAGMYKVEAYTAAAFAQSKQAQYVVTHAGATDTVMIDQSAVDGWQTIGEFAFAAAASSPCTSATTPASSPPTTCSSCSTACASRGSTAAVPDRAAAAARVPAAALAPAPTVVPATRATACSRAAPRAAAAPRPRLRSRSRSC